MATERTNTTIEIREVMAGARVVETGEHKLALGFPEEAVKAWMLAGMAVTAWIIPDVRTAFGIVQWALEFPLYHALFIRGLLAKGEKIPVIVREGDWNDVVEYLRLTLLGLSEQEMRSVGVNAETARMLSHEAEALALKKGGAVAQIDDFLEPIFYDGEGVAELDGLRIKRHGDNTWSFYTDTDRIEEYRLKIPEGQQPVYASHIPPATTPVVPQPFEAILLGASNGFDPNNPCSNIVVQSNGRFVLVDAGPYIRSTLRHAGIGLNQLSAVVITHAHEDHAVGLSALLELRRRLTLYVTRENAEILRRKVAILNPEVDAPERLLDDAFEVTYVEPGQTHDLWGLSLRFHYTYHPIPCTGVELSASVGGVDKKLLVVGDNDTRAHIAAAAEAGAISAAHHAALEKLFDWNGDLIIADAGGGPIHGECIDFDDNPSPVVYIHTGSLPDALRHRYTLGRAGHRYTMIPAAGLSALERGLAHRALHQAFARVGDRGADGAEWINALLDAGRPINANVGQLVVRQGDEDRDVYVVLTGELCVALAAEQGAAQTVAHLDSGEIFGEMAAVNGAPRSASVIAETPSRLLCIPGDVFARFAEHMHLGTGLPEIWQKRALLDRVSALADASVTTKNILASRAVRRTIEPGATLIREASRSKTVFVLVEGRVQVYKGTEPLLVGGAPIIVPPGNLIGETAPFLNKARNASIVTLDECEVLAIRGSDFERIVKDSPQLFRHISQTVRERRAA